MARVFTCNERIHMNECEEVRDETILERFGCNSTDGSRYIFQTERYRRQKTFFSLGSVPSCSKSG